nr:MAG TPA: hypothetical protein [Bacteriophage sp.]
MYNFLYNWLNNAYYGVYQSFIHVSVFTTIYLIPF